MIFPNGRVVFFNPQLAALQQAAQAQPLGLQALPNSLASSLQMAAGGGQFGSDQGRGLSSNLNAFNLQNFTGGVGC